MKQIVINKEKKLKYIKKIKGLERTPLNDKIFYAMTYTVISIILIAVLYPLIYILSASFSSPSAVSTGKVWLLPVELSLAGYKAVFKYKDVFIGYRNTVFYTLVGTAINVGMTLIAAYPLARKNLPGRGVFTFLFTFTMLFSGGMIPHYLLMRDLDILNTPWAMLLPGAINITNLIITRTFMQSSIPGELLEAAQIDGCSDFRYFFMIVLPLSKANIAVITLYYAVGHWNAYFNALLYLTSKKLFPLQVFLREVLLLSNIDATTVADPQTLAAVQGLSDLLKYSLIVVATAPILCIYPLVQRYFEKGVMIGSLKG